jgi:endonuclease YncB( thermonuclease family)
MILIERWKRRIYALSLVASLMAVTNRAMGAGSFFKEESTPSPIPSAAAPAPTHNAGSIAPSPVVPSPIVTVAPQAAPMPSPIVTGPKPVRDLRNIPEADWRSLGLFIAQKRGLANVSPDFLSGWVGLSDCAQWMRARTDEFAMEDLRSKARAAIAEASRVTRVRIKLDVALREYDFSKRAFPLDPITQNTALRVNIRTQCPGLYLWRSSSGFPVTVNVTMMKDAPWDPDIPVPPEQAHTIVERMQGNRNATAELVVDLDDIMPSPLSYVATLSAEPVAMFIWRDPSETQYVGAIGRFEPGANLARAVEPSPVETQHTHITSIGPSFAGGLASSQHERQSTETPAASANSSTALANIPAPMRMAMRPAETAAPTVVTGAVSEVINEATLLVAGHAVRLADIEPSGSPILAKQFAHWLQLQGSHVSCQLGPHGYRCLTPKGVDIAQAAIMNGAGRPAPYASHDYFAAEAEAEARRRGVWAR